jgi:small-conductance mechanosensitive channel
MQRSAKIWAALTAALLAGTLVALWIVREPPPARQASGPAAGLDHRLFDAVRQSAALAETPAEQDLAREARRLADHELDLAFAGAVREAAAYRPPPNGPLERIRARIEQAKQRIAQSREQIAKVPANNPDLLDISKAQLALDEDELEDAQADLARQGGDPRTAVQRAMAEREASQRDTSVPRLLPTPSTDSLAEQFSAWRALGARVSQLDAVRQLAASRSAALSHEHDGLEALIAQRPVPAPLKAGESDEFAEDNSVMVARLRSLSDQRKTLTELDRRVQDCNQVAASYRSWIGLVEGRRTGIARLMLHSLSWIFGVLLLAVLVETALHRALHDGNDRHRSHQRRFVVSISVRLAAILAILLIVFGPPSQLSTVIGLITAGLTVVLRDFVVAFIGWFVLLGRNGVRIGDWVEINGLGGEVIEIGLFKTTLLEMGTGHPTGRRVSFMNGYAFEGHWFNFSTAGQWLWDELQISVPAGLDPYATLERIREVVEQETEANSQLAEQDWKRITEKYGTRAFSARPSVSLRPGAQGFEVGVRYIARGPERYETKSKLFRKIVDLLRTGS